MKKKETKIQKEKASLLKEKYLYEFCKKRGWNPNDLSTGQMLILVKSEGYL